MGISMDVKPGGCVAVGTAVEVAVGIVVGSLTVIVFVGHVSAFCNCAPASPLPSTAFEQETSNKKDSRIKRYL
jgi:hypothetical protein